MGPAPPLVCSVHILKKYLGVFQGSLRVAVSRKKRHDRRETPSHAPRRPARFSGHGGRGALHVPRKAGVWGAGAPMVVASGVLGPVALIPHVNATTTE